MQAKAAKPRPASPSPLRRTSTSKGVGFHITSESIAADLAAFRKQGGRIEVLGNTPLRAAASASAFRSKSRTGADPLPTAPAPSRERSERRSSRTR